MVTNGTISSVEALWGLEKRLFMHDFLIALVFVAMVTSPAVIASSFKTAMREDR